MKATAGLIPANSSCSLPDRFACRAVRRPSPLAKLVRLPIALGLALSTAIALAQNRPLTNTWQSLWRLPDRPASEIWVRAQRFHAVALDHAALQSALAHAPLEAVQPALTSPAEILLPMPDGSLARFRFVE